MRRSLLWDTALGFVGFFAVLALIQALMNILSPSPALWPGLLAGALCLLEFLLWRAKLKDLR
ncbi:hypothetical protein [Corynebacterium sp.]|uniref:hypothetical protein n=1 Tax=Corynebacterium sp. TaxID=1720 RepID=UPI0026DA9E53|nr:hypothetical protein [Corynebacterium sp.]MDO5031143.1 hypothetical protein [Corynebacterium sp.]